MCKLFRKSSVTNWYKQWEDDKDVDSEVMSSKIETLRQERLAPWYFENTKIARNLDEIGIRKPKAVYVSKKRTINPNK